MIELMRGRRPLTGRRVVSLLLIIAALAVIAVAGPPGADRSQVAAGLGLSLGSAGCIAAFITIVPRVAGKTPATLGAGVQMLCSGLLLSPALLGLRDDRGGLIVLLATAIALFAPACLLYWRTLRKLAPVAAGSIQLCEPFFGAAAAAALYAVRPTGLELLSAVLVLAAVFLELGKTVPDATAVSSQPGAPKPS